jgi:hypothetical protein
MPNDACSTLAAALLPDYTATISRLFPVVSYAADPMLTLGTRSRDLLPLKWVEMLNGPGSEIGRLMTASSLVLSTSMGRDLNLLSEIGRHLLEREVLRHAVPSPSFLTAQSFVPPPPKARRSRKTQKQKRPSRT